MTKYYPVASGDFIVGDTNGHHALFMQFTTVRRNKRVRKKRYRWTVSYFNGMKYLGAYIGDQCRTPGEAWDTLR